MQSSQVNKELWIRSRFHGARLRFVSMQLKYHLHGVCSTTKEVGLGISGQHATGSRSKKCRNYRRVRAVRVGL